VERVKPWATPAAVSVRPALYAGTAPAIESDTPASRNVTCEFLNMMILLIPVQKNLAEIRLILPDRTYHRGEHKVLK
jgi:hypothetical protein